MPAAAATAEVFDLNQYLDSPESVAEIFRNRKAARITKQLAHAPEDTNALRRLAIERYGLVNDDLRAQVWPRLLGVQGKPQPPKPKHSKLERHKDYRQVVMDVERSLRRFPPGMDEEVRMSYQDKLVETIVHVLFKNSDLHYYQGYHDIVVTFLLILKDEDVYNLVETVSRSHLREHLYPSIAVTAELLKLVPVLLNKDSRGAKISDLLEKHGVPASFSIAWVITWFGHVLADLSSILRLYDFFLASHPLMPIYFSAALVLNKSDAVLALPPEDVDFAILHSSLVNIPSKSGIPLELIISESCRLVLEHPPETIQSPSWLDNLNIFEPPRSKSSKLNVIIMKARFGLIHLFFSKIYIIVAVLMVFVAIFTYVVFSPMTKSVLV